MMIYKVVYTEKAISDLDDIFRYIAYVLLEPEIAKRQVSELMDGIDSLETMPKRHPLSNEKRLREKKVRVLPVNHYNVYYGFEDKSQTVNIFRIIYRSRNSFSLS